MNRMIDIEIATMINDILFESLSFCVHGKLPLEDDCMVRDEV